jgi:hypothetical protein
MEDFKQDIRNRLFGSGKYIVAELQATSHSNRRWISIYKTPPHNDLSFWPKRQYEYSILDFELSKDLIDEYFADEDKQFQKEYFANSEVELLNLLHSLGISPSIFTYPWKCDYPL